jgi:hypothetical protein
LVAPLLRKLMPTVAWSIFGLSVWMGGQHAPARAIGEVSAMADELIDNHFATLLGVITDTSV